MLGTRKEYFVPIFRAFFNVPLATIFFYICAEVTNFEKIVPRKFSNSIHYYKHFSWKNLCRKSHTYIKCKYSILPKRKIIMEPFLKEIHCYEHWKNLCRKSHTYIEWKYCFYIWTFTFLLKMEPNVVYIYTLNNWKKFQRKKNISRSAQNIFFISKNI